MSDQSYAGDVSPQQAWKILEQDSAAVLVDCRTDAEWSWVGLPDLSELGRAPVCVAWQCFPDMARNDAFLSELESQGVTKDADPAAAVPLGPALAPRGDRLDRRRLQLLLQCCRRLRGAVRRRAPPGLRQRLESQRLALGSGLSRGLKRTMTGVVQKASFGGPAKGAKSYRRQTELGARRAGAQRLPGDRGSDLHDLGLRLPQRRGGRGRLQGQCRPLHLRALRQSHGHHVRGAPAHPGGGRGLPGHASSGMAAVWPLCCASSRPATGSSRRARCSAPAT